MTRLNLISPISPGAEAAEADQGSIEVYNAFVDKLSGSAVFKTRPGLVKLNELPDSARVDVHWLSARNYLIVVCGSKIYYKATLDGELIDITPTGTLKPGYNAKVLFTSNEYGVMMSTGIGLIWWNGESANAVAVNDANAPTEISDLAYLNGYIFAVEKDTQKFAWATYGPEDPRDEPPIWSAFRLSASSSPDNLLAIATEFEELFLLGNSSFESQYITGDATVVAKSIQGAAGKKGIVNNKVLKSLANNYVYMTPNREVVFMQGRTPQVVSEPIAYQLEELDKWDDVEAFTLFDRFYILTFRTENRTHVFDVKTGLWYRWEYWNASDAKYTRFLGTSSAHAKDWGRHIIGGINGKLYMADYKTVTDGGDLIRGKILTASIDQGTLERKFVSEIRLRLRRGY